MIQQLWDDYVKKPPEAIPGGFYAKLNWPLLFARCTSFRQQKNDQIFFLKRRLQKQLMMLYYL
ncbi:hypothetical protein Desku_0301 [Desulfofundulus kuznetsovii DSM 6115]|uniref:Uncharacterized protein n=1 Tax=Desulfofundulus kuznetsovii (strain DSM 6115 / VKM B-1805 / 17) TaxID=760568 RepID=A0AAU8PKU7_DESK7|nr:hypothetical protein Desku_0301 [Desulfofundulus kuznetsovii DSM 6115]